MKYFRNFDKQADAIGVKAYIPTVAIVGGGVDKVGFFNGDPSKEYIFGENGDFINVEEKETRVICTYNVTSTTEATNLIYIDFAAQNFENFSMEVDGVELTAVKDKYTFTTTGEHIVKYIFKDNTTIGQYAFCECSSLTSVVIPDSVTSIGDSAFFYCTGLTSIVIPDSVTSIDSGAFQSCSSLTSIVIPDSVTSIGSSAFYACSGLTSVVIPDSVTSIDSGAFNNSQWYNSYIADTANQHGNIVYINNVAYKATSTDITSCEFKEGTVSIGGAAFQSCSSLTSVTIPNSVTSIGRYAFQSCSSLTSIVIPDSVTSIGSYAFQSCSSLTSINYKGTVAQWEAITKGTKWHKNVPSTTKVTCTDGTCGLDDTTA
jgi:hypothetical protein